MYSIDRIRNLSYFDHGYRQMWLPNLRGPACLVRTWAGLRAILLL